MHLISVLHALVFAKCTFARDGQAVGNYCGTEEIAEYPEWDSGPELLSVNTFFRHGTRADYRRTTCFKQGAQTMYTSSLSTGFELLTVHNSTPARNTISKNYKRGFQVGEILDYSAIQMKRLGTYLRESYPNIYEKTNLRNLFLRSTDTQRTLGSLNLLLSNLEGESKELSYVVETDDFEYDPLNLNCQSCLKASQIRDDFPHSEEFLELLASTQYFQCAKRWKDEVGTDFDISQGFDCLIAPTCAKVPFPGDLVPSDTLIECVSELALAIRRMRYSSSNGVDFCQLATAPFLVDLLDNIESNKSGLWSTHDDTLVCILSSAGIWDGEWPHYGAFISIESYADKSIRVIRDGVDIARLSIEGIVREDIRSREGLMHRCNRAVSVPTVAEEPEVLQSVGWGVRLMGVFSIVGLLAIF